MRFLLAIFLPWVQFSTIGRPIAGFVCLALQLSLIGWIPAAIWSIHALLGQYTTDSKMESTLAARRNDWAGYRGG